MVLVWLVDGGTGCALRGLFTLARRELTFRQEGTGGEYYLLLPDGECVGRFSEHFADGRYIEGV